MLRQTLLCLCFYSIFSTLSGQAYQPLVLEDAHWKICQTSSEDTWSCGLLYEYFLGTDTIVDNLDYYKLYRRDFLANGEPGGGLGAYDLPLRIISETLAGLIREDLSGRKVYWRNVSTVLCPDDPTDEILLYDFALSVGDTLESCALGATDTVVVTAINLATVYGTERRVFELSTGFELIEGIGFTSGLLEIPVPPVSIISTSLFDYCRAPDMDCNVAVLKGMVNPYQEWHVHESIFDFTSGSTLITFEYRFRNPEFVEDHVYFQLEERQAVIRPEWTYTGWRFRQDGDKVYRKYTFEPDEEELVYDFSLTEIGDTFLLNTFALGEATMHLVLVDTIVLDNGEQRRRQHWEQVDVLNQPWYWITGFGSNDHPFFTYNTFIDNIDGEQRKLQCFYVEPDLENPQWQNELFTECYDYLVASEELQKIEVRVFPNPTCTEITLQGVTPGDRFSLYDVYGKEVKQIIVDTPLQTLNLYRLPNGVYHYLLSSGEGVFRKTGKIVKTK